MAFKLLIFCKKLKFCVQRKGLGTFNVQLKRSEHSMKMCTLQKTVEIIISAQPKYCEIIQFTLQLLDFWNLIQGTVTEMQFFKKCYKTLEIHVIQQSNGNFVGFWGILLLITGMDQGKDSRSTLNVTLIRISYELLYPPESGAHVFRPSIHL